MTAHSPCVCFAVCYCCPAALSCAGILAYLDEECLLGQGTDSTFLDKLESNLKSHPHFERTKEKSKTHEQFVVKHYAGQVQYAANGFLDKNKVSKEEETWRTAQKHMSWRIFQVKCSSRCL